MSESGIGRDFEVWSQNEPVIQALVLLGSRARQPDRIGSYDHGSDWDYHVVTSDTALFTDATWATRASLSKPLAYVARSGHVSRIIKASGIFANGEIDLVLLPVARLRVAKLLLRVGLAQRIPSVRNVLSEMAVVLLPGYCMVKGRREWGDFFASVVSDIVPLRINDKMVCDLAEAYVVDYVSTRRKIIRGELIAAQRWLHIQLAETNFRLLHELRLRLSEPSFPDGRRLEILRRDQWFDAIRVNTMLDRECLLMAIEKSASTCRELVKHLVGSKWNWPNVS